MIRRTLAVLMILSAPACSSEDFDARKEIIGWMEKTGHDQKLHAPVEITSTEAGTILVKDTGIFLFQYMLLTPAAAVDPNIVFAADLCIPPSIDKAVIVTHGWFDKGQEHWPSEMASHIRARTDPNEWLCASCDWKGGSVVLSSIHAAEYARDIAGPRLARSVLSLPNKFRHIHLIGHSAGSWTIHSAAKTIALEQPDITIHLTFLDAYIPSRWDPDQLGNIPLPAGQYWADHYYTRDITYKVTQQNLSHAHNVDITALDPWITEHEFPYRWYDASITGSFTRWDEKTQTVVTKTAACEYGFVRGLESSQENWQQSLALPLGKSAVKIPKSK